MTWWRVKPPEYPEFLVLVVNGRVAARTSGQGFECVVGALWADARKALDARGYKCTMETL